MAWLNAPRPTPGVVPGLWNGRVKQTSCRPGDCSADAHWRLDIYQFFETVVPLLEPDYVIFNRGV